MIFEIPPRKCYGTEYLAYWEDFLLEEDYQYLNSLSGWKEMEKGKLGGDLNTENFNPEIRNSKVTWLDLQEDNLDLWKRIVATVAEVNRRFFHFDLTGCYEKIQLSEYDETDQGHYSWHTDDSGEDSSFIPRKLSMAILLSNPEDFEGGLLQVKINNDEPRTLEMKKGRAWFFPSFVLHRVSPITKGKRRSLVLWVGGPQFR